MKITNPRKFRKALNYLHEYLASSTGIEHYDEWYGEVEAVREEIDPKDWHRFDVEVQTLEKMGLGIHLMWKAFNTEEEKYRARLSEMFDAMWEETKAKRKAK